MKLDQNDQKECTNCRYYVQHFSKLHAELRTINCGHCLRTRVKESNRQPHHVCAYWESMAIQKEERKQEIEHVLRNMSKRLNEISMILQDDAK